jgi:hypothetical protein
MRWSELPRSLCVRASRVVGGLWCARPWLSAVVAQLSLDRMSDEPDVGRMKELQRVFK